MTNIAQRQLDWWRKRHGETGAQTHPALRAASSPLWDAHAIKYNDTVPSQEARTQISQALHHPIGKLSMNVNAPSLHESD